MLSHVANSFVDTRFDHRLVFFHTDCAALRGNTVFGMLNRKRASFTPDTTGDLAFNRKMAANLMEQIRNANKRRSHVAYRHHRYSSRGATLRR
jgi:hypothetical protein